MVCYALLTDVSSASIWRLHVIHSEAEMFELVKWLHGCDLEDNPKQRELPIGQVFLDFPGAAYKE